MTKMFRFYAVLTIIVPLMVVASSGKVTAHVLKQNSGISAVLHIPPEDNPTAGELTEINVAYGDDKGKFSLQNCDCQIQIEQNEKTLQTMKAVPALEGATQDSAVMTTIQKAGKYKVVVKGKSTNKSFNEFALEYPITIIGTQTSNAGPEVAIVSIGILLILGMVAYSTISFGKRY